LPGGSCNVDTKTGFFSHDAWPGLPANEGWDWGVAATQLSLDGGLVTVPELRAGVIDHALSASWKDSCKSFFMYPAQGKDGQDSSPACLPEGAKLQLDPTYNVDGDSNPPMTKALEHAAQTYGIIIRDRTLHSFAIYAEDTANFQYPTNPYTSGPGVGGVDSGNRGFFGGQTGGQLLKNFPWSRLRVIASTHCTTAPPPACGP
jgi:hypothetical protein